jgi:PAS domain S-box-containing protein
MKNRKQIDEQILVRNDRLPWEILDHLDQGIAILAADGRFTSVNAAFAQLVSHELVDLTGKLVADFIHPHDQEAFTQINQQNVRGKQATGEVRLVKPDGTAVFVQIAAVPRLEAGVFVGSYYIVTNLMAQKQADELIRRSEERYRRVVEDQTEFIVRWLPDGTRTFVNEAYCHYFGTTKNQMLGSSFFPLIHEKDRQAVKTKIASLTPENPVAQDEHRTRMPDGSIRWHRWTDRAIFSDAAQIVEIQSVGQDITEQKLAEAAFKRSESNLNAIINNTLQSFILLDQDGQIQALNSVARDRGKKILGREIKTGNDFLETIKPMDPGKFWLHFNEALTGKTTTIEEKVTTQDGNTYWFEANYTPVVEEDGTISGVVLSNLNITQRKKAEQALLFEKAFSDAIVDSLPGAFFVFNKEGRFLRWNKNMERVVGFAEDEVREMQPIELIVEQDRSLVTAKIAEIFSKGEAEVEAHLLTQDGRAIPYLFTSRLIRLDDGPAAVGLGLDISDRYQAAEMMRQSEANLRAIFNNTLQAFVLFDQERCVRAANPVANNWSRQVLGKPLNKGERADDLFAQFDLESFKELFHRSLAGETIIQERKIMGGSQEFWFETNYNPVATEDGLIYGVSISVLNITERKKAEEALQHSKTELQYIIDTVPEGVMLLKADGTVLMTNPVADEFLQVLAPEFRDGCLDRLGNQPLSMLFTSPPQGLWHEISHDDFTFEAIAQPIENRLNQTGWVLVLRDVTQERDIRLRVQRQERLAAVGQLAAGIAHDFNNIMAVIILYSQLLSRNVEIQPKDQEKLNTIEKQARRATDLIQQILDFSRQSILERKPLDLLPFMKEVIKLLERTLSEDIRIELLYGDDHYLIQADPSRIQQVLMNLAINARDAMPHGGKLSIRMENVFMKPGTVLLVPEMPPGNWVQIQVVDDGIGIPPETLSHIFEPFFTTKKIGQGTGLGLAQVYGIVQQHEGYIDVSSQPGKGTKFSLYFPVLDTEKEQGTTFDTSAIQQGAGQMVLLVEDNQATREALVDSLHVLNYSVIETANGREALDILETRTQDISLVLSDVIMPEMGGIALYHEMRQRHLDIPLILLTGHPFSKEFENLKEMGLAAWIVKPPELTALSKLLFQVLN